MKFQMTNRTSGKHAKGTETKPFQYSRNLNIERWSRLLRLCTRTVQNDECPWATCMELICSGRAITWQKHAELLMQKFKSWIKSTVFGALCNTSWNLSKILHLISNFNLFSIIFTSTLSAPNCAVPVSVEADLRTGHLPPLSVKQQSAELSQIVWPRMLRRATAWCFSYKN